MRVAALLTSLAWGFVVAALAYASWRLVDIARGPAVDPATVAYASQASFVWRALTASFAGALATFPAYATFRRFPLAVARALSGAVVIAAVLGGLQAALFP